VAETGERITKRPATMSKNNWNYG